MGLKTVVRTPLQLVGALVLAGAFAASGARMDLIAGARTDAAIIARLEALSPDDPRAYFELAEDVEDRAADAEDKALARQLYGLAGALAPQTFGRSACLALASMADVNDERSTRRFRKLAAMLDFQSLVAGGAGAANQQGDSTTAAFALASALSDYRTGRGKQALSTFEANPAARELLQEHEHIVRGGLRRFLEDCKLYSGGEGPQMSEETISQMLRVEAALLASPAHTRDWSGDLLLTRHRPLVEVDPQRLDEAFDVNAERPLYRGGQWVAMQR